MRKLITAKITLRSLQLLRLLAAQTGKPQCDILEPILEREWEWTQQNTRSKQEKKK